VLSQEIKKIQEKKSSYQICMRTITARETYLEKLKDEIFTLTEVIEKRDKN